MKLAAALCALLGASAAVSLPDDFDVQAAMENPDAFGDDVLAEILRVNDPSLVVGGQGFPGADGDNETDADMLLDLAADDDAEDTYAGLMSEDSELLAFSLCQFGLSSTQSQRDGSDTDLMVIKYVSGKALHEQCQRASDNKLWACGAAKPYWLSSNCPWWYRSHTSYNWYDQRAGLFKTSAARTGMYTSFVTTGNFDNWKHRMPNCDSINVAVCCSSECEGW